jgi:outer membrane murein-binding lipoprotein Lpp
MRDTWTRWTVVAGIVLAGCGKSAEGPVVGTWELDVEATIEANLAPALSESRAQLAKLEAEMKQAGDRIQAAPEDQRAVLREGARAKMLEGAKGDADRTEVLKAMFRSMKEASDLVEKKARERVAGIAEAKVDMTFRPDQSFLMRFERDREIDVVTGTWSRGRPAHDDRDGRERHPGGRGAPRAARDGGERGAAGAEVGAHGDPVSA